MDMLKDLLLEIFNKHIIINIIDLLITIGVIAIISFSVPCFSETIDTPNPAQDLKKLHITADSLVANQNNQYVVFSGQVVALYELTTITSDKLQVFYTDQADEEKFNKSSIKKIIASGNVHIDLEEKTAECDQAVYDTPSNSLVLTGEETRLQSKNSFITGNKITIHQNTGQIIVHGNDDKRVNAIFQPEEKNSITDIQ
jgi:lipopolysaccharide export system protein LptA